MPRRNERAVIRHDWSLRRSPRYTVSYVAIRKALPAILFVVSDAQTRVRVMIVVTIQPFPDGDRRLKRIYYLK